jgi:hypothetical protein
MCATQLATAVVIYGSPESIRINRVAVQNGVDQDDKVYRPDLIETFAVLPCVSNYQTI